MGEKKDHTIRVYFHNVRGISPADRMEAHLIHCQQWKEKGIDVLGIAESNVNWRLPSIQMDFDKATKKAWPYYKATMATCRAKTENKAQPGGTVQVTVGPFLTKIANYEADNIYGRWSAQTYRGRRGKKLVIMTAYCPTAKQVTGPRRIIQQQRTVMIQEGIRNKEPTEHFFDKVKEQIREWKKQGHEVLIMMDANYTLEERYVRDLVTSLGLFDIHKEMLETPAGTFERGGRRIDMMLGTDGVLDCVTQCGYEEYNQVAVSDHRAVYADFDFRKILGKDSPDLTNPTHRNLSSDRPKHNHWYKEMVHRYFVKHRVYQRAEEIVENPKGLSMQRLQIMYEKLDKDITRAMISAEKVLKTRSDLPWSPVLKKAIDATHYWSAMIRVAKKGRKVTNFIQRTGEELGRVYEDDRELPLIQMEKSRKQAYKELRKVRKTAKDMREQFLIEQAAAYEMAGWKDAAVALRQLKRWEQQRDQAALLKRRLKKAKVGHINKLWIPKDQNETPSNLVKEWEEITEPEEIERQVIQQNIKHFGQANNTPFTMEPLRSMQQLADPMAQDISRGEVPTEIRGSSFEETVALLKALEIPSNLEQIEWNLDLTTLKGIYRHWKEKTATSPSGRHLGHFHALLKPDGIDRTDESENIQADRADDIWIIHLIMIQTAVKWGYVPERWKEVLTLMLEKKPGQPYLHRLRPINLYESEVNALLKHMIAKVLIGHAEGNHLLHDAQWGSRPLRRATDALLQKMLTLEQVRMGRLILGIVYLDAKACYDRIPSNLTMLVYKRFGLPDSLCELIKLMLDSSNFRIRTQLGVSKRSYRHTKDSPIYGNGQGSASSPALWAMISSLLYQCHRELNQGALLHDPITKEELINYLVGFVDDNTLFVTHQSKESIAECMRASLQSWERLLYTTGGALALEKCEYHVVTWEYEEDGKARMQQPEDQKMALRVTAGRDQTEEIIQQLAPHKETRMLGGHFTPLGSFQREVEYLHEKAITWTQKIAAGGISKADARKAYFAYLNKAIAYSAPVISLNKEQCGTIQQEATTAVLHSQGVSSKFPRVVAFAPISIGGLGLRNLYTDHGVFHVMEAQRHIRYGTSIGKLMTFNVNWAQLISGQREQLWMKPEIDLTYLKEFDCIWIERIQKALRESGTQLWIERAWKPKRQRVNDQFLMEAFCEAEYKTHELAHLNRCRIWLQVLTLADVISPSGTYIKENYLKPGMTRPKRSRWLWPNQIRPKKEIWALWQRALKKTFLKRSSRNLITPLGAWSQEPNTIHMVWPWSYDPQSTIVYAGEKWAFLRVKSKDGQLRYSQDKLQVKDIPRTFPCEVQSERREFIMKGRPTIQKRSPGEAQWITWFTTKQTLIWSRRQIVEKLRQEALFIATDGSLVRTKGTFAWMMGTTEEQKLAEGAGPVLGAAQSMTSHRAEMFGVLAALCCVRALNIDEAEAPKNFTIYCDSKSVVNWFKANRREHYKHADDDIGLCIQELRRQLPMFFAIQHVKSHQKIKDKPPLEVKMNEEVDKSAARQQQHTTEEDCRQPNFWAPIGASIQKQGTLSTHLEITLRCETHREPLTKYHQEKFEWTDETVQSIDDEVHRQFMKRLSVNLAWFTVRMRCRLLPTNALLHKQKRRATAMCQGCQHPVEDNMHFLTCRKRTKKRRELEQQLHTFYKESNTPVGVGLLIDNAIRYTFWNEGLSQGTQPRVQQLRVAQNNIGWNQLCHGMMANVLVKYMQRYYEELPVKRYTGCKWAVELCIIMCKWAHQQWIDRCDLEHSHLTGQTSEQENIFNTAKQWYERRHELGTDYGNFFHESWETFRTRPSQYIKNWVNVNGPALEELWRTRPPAPRQTTLLESWCKGGLYR